MINYPLAIAILRRERETQVLAKMLGCSAPTVSQWAHGRKMPCDDNAAKIVDLCLVEFTPDQCRQCRIMED